MRCVRIVLFVVASVVLLSGCGSRDVKLTVVNDSPTPLTNVVAAVPGFVARVGSIAAASRSTVTVPRPQGHAGFMLSFEADGKRFTHATGSDPWDGFKEIIMTISPQFGVGVESVTTF